jgi:glucokinase
VPASPSGPFYVGVDLGGTKVLALAATGDGHVLGTALAATPEGGDHIIAAMATVVEEAVGNAGLRPTGVACIGIAAAGGIDHEHGRIVFSPNIPAMSNTPVVELLRAKLDILSVMGNDAQLAALGEQRFGAGRGHDNLLFITISTGIGGGIIVGNQLFKGVHGQAGEVGHISVDARGPNARSMTAGAWEAFCSGTALVRIAGERMQVGEASSMTPDGLSAPDIFEAMRAGDALARSVIDDAIVYLGAGLTSLVNVLDPGKIIIGGGLSNEWDSYIAPGVELMRKQAFAGVGNLIDIVPPELGAQAGALGGVALAQDATQTS